MIDRHTCVLGNESLTGKIEETRKISRRSMEARINVGVVGNEKIDPASASIMNAPSPTVTGFRARRVPVVKILETQ